MGGGLVMVPPLRVNGSRHRFRQQRGSLAVIIFSSIWGDLYRVAGDNALFWTTGLILGIGGVVGAPIGARILSRVSKRTSTIIFQLTLVAVTISLLVKIFTH